MILFRTFNCLNYTPAAPAAPSAASPRPASCHCQTGRGGQDEKLLKLGIHFPICQCRMWKKRLASKAVPVSKVTSLRGTHEGDSGMQYSSQHIAGFYRKQSLVVTNYKPFHIWKGVCHEIFDLHFFHDSNPSRPLINRLKYFRFRLDFRSHCGVKILGFANKLFFFSNLFFHDRCVHMLKDFSWLSL